MSPKLQITDCEIVPHKKANVLRKAFVDKFADKNLPQYETVMGFGEAYGAVVHNYGCLWEVIRPFTPISRDIAYKIIQNHSEVYVMWDRPSENLPRALQKSRMLKLESSVLAERLKERTFNSRSEFAFLPDDLYVFDEAMSFFVILTHVSMPHFKNICLTSLTDLEDKGVPPLLQELFDFVDMGSPNVD